MSRWRQCWNPEEVKKRSVFFLPVCVDDVAAPRDWLLAVVKARSGQLKLGEAEQLEIVVHDRLCRRTLSERIARFVQALFYLW